MIFALIDLCRYRFRLGHYGDDPGKNIMALGHTNRVTEETLQVMAEGDMVICQRMNSMLSWAIMYFGGGYAVDHVAIYIGDGKVIHATLSGVKVHSIHTLACGARVLPFRLYGLDEADPGFKERSPRTVQDEAVNSTKEAPANPGNASGQQDVLPPYLQLLMAGIGIALGLQPMSFRWHYYLDLGLMAALLDLFLWKINQFPMACTIWGGWLLVLVQLRVRFRAQLRAGRKFKPDSHPGLAVQTMWSQGGYVFPSRPINGHWKVRILPGWAAPSLLQQKAPQSQSQQSGQGSSASDQ